ncbi:Eco57I restriction-modification methylase domain-containing protein [Calothrix sp. 336/3]|uniref:Eco57I restriction-modification methylase domain-containing protein n=1 Tax=Calothrix sp. 336/3 TaxID=1337936 RepID=UPI0004E32C1B|nr:RNA-binding domain-containing protein [Calothrix sp. 336/3]AKG21364.1 transcriptional regulator [Calothrix sp. 336/3]
MALNFQRTRDLLRDFKFEDLFIEELGWSQSTRRKSIPLEVEEKTYEYKCIAEVSGVAVFEVIGTDGIIPGVKIRAAIHQEIAKLKAENLLIFIDETRTRSLWYWVKRDGNKTFIRDHVYVKGQPGDLFLSKLASLVIDITEYEDDSLSVVQIAQRLQKAFDVERVTKQFYKDFQEEHKRFLGYVKGINHESDRRWYTSIILNRLMFVYFLQRKGFIDKSPNKPNGDLEYLQNKLKESQQRGENLFYGEFLQVLFFETFAKPEHDRDESVKPLVGNVKYLNGGLFLRHRIEQEYNITIADEAFEQVLELFARYTWNLDDTPEGKDDEINPDVLGYIFEKYINQKAFGAYYTRPQITEYLCDRTIHKLIVDRVNETISDKFNQFEDINQLLLSKEQSIYRLLFTEILPKLSILDPACGSGAFLIAAMKTLIQVYGAAIGSIKLIGDARTRDELQELENVHKSIAYYIKKRIVTDNLYGVDIMEEATEIAKLRLFLALVASAHDVDELEPLPNIDFNIMAGNSLIGLIGVNADNFDKVKLTKKAKARGYKQDNPDLQLSLFQSSSYHTYQGILEEKNKSIAMYKEHAFIHGKQQFMSLDEGTHQDQRLLNLRASIDNLNKKSQEKLNVLLLEEFSQKLKIKYEQVQLTGKAVKRDLTLDDIAALKPFHWGYHFDKILGRGGFDAIITNPPWEAFKPNGKEFFARYSELVTKKKMDIHTFEDTKEDLLQDREIANAWLDYKSSFPHVNLFYRSSSQYQNQISIVNGKKSKTTDINLYKLFLEQCFNLLKTGGECGIVIPSSLYNDLGAKQLREMLFTSTQISGLFCFENRKHIFEGVDSRSKFIILTFEKGGITEKFPAAFMRHDVQELQRFPSNESISINLEIVRRLSPDSLSIVEFKNEIDFHISEKMTKFPLLGEKLEDKWNLCLSREFHMTDDKDLFKSKFQGRLPLYEGKMIHQFTHKFAEPKYWVDEKEGRKAVLGRNGKDEGQKLDYQYYRLAYRSVAASTNERSLIASVLPPNAFFGHSMNASVIHEKGNDGNLLINSSEILFVTACLNSFIFDFGIRQRVSQNLTIFYIYQMPIPRLTEGDKYFSEICDRAAKLICTTPEFDELAASVGLESHTNGVTDETERAKLRAELDGIIAHLYGLTEDEFAYILTTFPIVPEQVKQDALAAYREFAPMTGDADIIELITTQDESSTLEFKSTARWDVDKNQKNPDMEQVILKTVASFLNTEQGGTLLIGVTDDKQIIGLDVDYQTFSKPNKRDAYQLFLINDLLLPKLGKDLATLIDVTFHEVERKDVCRITVKPSPRPVFVEIKTKGEKKQRCLFVRSGNLTSKLINDEEIDNYCKSRWK